MNNRKIIELLYKVLWRNTLTGRDIFVIRDSDSVNTPPSYLEFTEARNPGSEYLKSRLIKISADRYEN